MKVILFYGKWMDGWVGGWMDTNVGLRNCLAQWREHRSLFLFEKNKFNTANFPCNVTLISVAKLIENSTVEWVSIYRNEIIFMRNHLYNVESCFVSSAIAQLVKSMQFILWHNFLSLQSVCLFVFFFVIFFLVTLSKLCRHWLPTYLDETIHILALFSPEIFKNVSFKQVNVIKYISFYSK